MNLLILTILAQFSFGGWENFEFWHFKTGEDWLINKTNLNFSYFGDVYSLGGGLEYHAYIPDTNAPFDTLKKLQKYWLEGTYSVASIRVGTFTDNIGRGFLLYAGEEESAFLDRFVNGFITNIQIAPFRLKAFWGKPRSYVFYDLRNDTAEVIWGGSAEFERLISAGLTVELGSGYMRLNYPKTLMDKKHHTDFVSVFGGAYKGNLAFYTECAFRSGWNRTYYRDTTGYAIYLGIAYADPSGFNATVDFERMNRFGHDYMLPPTCNHMGIYLNDGRDEMAYSLSLSHLIENIRLNSQFSVTRGEFAGLKGWIYDHFLEISSDKLTIDLEYADIREAWSAGIHDRIEKSVKSKWFVPHDIEISTLVRHRLDGHEASYLDTDLSLSWSPVEMLTVVATFQNRSGDSTGTWTKLDVFTQVFDMVQLNLTVGKQRRELVCSGGVCRYEPEFDGVRLKAIISF